MIHGGVQWLNHQESENAYKRMSRDVPLNNSCNGSSCLMIVLLKSQKLHEVLPSVLKYCWLSVFFEGFLQMEYLYVCVLSRYVHAVIGDCPARHETRIILVGSFYV